MRRRFAGVSEVFAPSGVERTGVTALRLGFLAGNAERRIADDAAFEFADD